jgi:hypothetical protein
MNTQQTHTDPLAPPPTAPRRHPRRATMGDDWQIGYGPRRSAPAPQFVRAAPGMDLGAWFSRLLGLETGTPPSAEARPPQAPRQVVPREHLSPHVTGRLA